MVAADRSKTIADQDMERRITSQLAESHRPGLKRLAVRVNEGRVTLRGCVGSFHEKQIAIQACRMFAANERFVDAVEVAAAY